MSLWSRAGVLVLYVAGMLCGCHVTRLTDGPDACPAGGCASTPAADDLDAGNDAGARPAPADDPDHDASADTTAGDWGADGGIVGCTVCPDGQRCDDASGSCVECLEQDDCDLLLVCDPVSRRCVDCVTDQNCIEAGQAGRVCDGSRGECVDCLDDDDCEGRRCNTATNRCVYCVTDDHCSEPRPACLDGSCRECRTDDHCSGRRSTCDGTICVQCGGHDDCTEPAAAACDLGSSADRGLCEPCWRDEQCNGVVADDGVTALSDCSGGVCVAPPAE